MRASSFLSASAFFGLGAAICFFPEPADQICYNVAGATPQNLDAREVAFIAKYLRAYQVQAVAQGREFEHFFSLLSIGYIYATVGKTSPRATQSR